MNVEIEFPSLKVVYSSQVAVGATTNATREAKLVGDVATVFKRSFLRIVGVTRELSISGLRSLE